MTSGLSPDLLADENADVRRFSVPEARLQHGDGKEIRSSKHFDVLNVEPGRNEGRNGSVGSAVRMTPLIPQPCDLPAFGNADSPRTRAHFAMIQALTTHDAELLEQALGEARAAGMPNSTLEPVERAMAALSGYVACGNSVKRREITQKLDKAAKGGQEGTLKDVLMEAIEYRVEEGFAQAERALVASRLRKSRVLDRVVAVMEDCAESAEVAMSQKAAGCTPKNLADLKQALDEARVHVDTNDEVILCANRLLAFETGRLMELNGLEHKLREHVSKMEGIVDTLQRQHPVSAEVADTAADAGQPLRGSETYARTATAAMMRARDLQHDAPCREEAAARR